MRTADVNLFERQADCTYRDDDYSVRDNGAVFRHSRVGKRKRPLDDIWTFGTPCSCTGYMKMSKETIHRIVATSFHGPQPSRDNVVDHIDTNRRNNRPENLRWVTRLENILLNPITAKRVEYLCGSVENFLADPSSPRDGTLTKDFEWMRTVTLAEADYSRKRLLDWAQSDRASSGGTLGDWLFRPRREPREEDAEPFVASRTPGAVQRRQDILGEFPWVPEPRQEQSRESHFDVPEKEPELLVTSKTPGAVQRYWRLPAEFPFCPQPGNDQTLEVYFDGLEEDAVFAVSPFGQTKVVKAEFGADSGALFVLGALVGEGIKPWSLAKVTYEDGRFVHESCGTFFARDGAEKQFTLIQGLPWEGGDSIDDYC